MRASFFLLLLGDGRRPPRRGGGPRDLRDVPDSASRSQGARRARGQHGPAHRPAARATPVLVPGRRRRGEAGVADLSGALAQSVRIVGRQPRDAVVEGKTTPVVGKRLRGRQHGRLTLGPPPDQGPGPVRRGRDDRPLDQVRRDWCRLPLGELTNGRRSRRTWSKNAGPVMPPSSMGMRVAPVSARNSSAYVFHDSRLVRRCRLAPRCPGRARARCPSRGRRRRAGRRRAAGL